MSMERDVHEYTAKTARSRALFEDALLAMPGGNSRTTTFFDPYPFYIQRGQGAHVWDADGNDRVDFNGNYTSLILGHAPPAVVEAVQRGDRVGTVVSGPHRARGSTGRGSVSPPSVRRARALHQLGHGGDHERGAAGPRVHRPPEDRQVRGRLPRHPRLGHGERHARPQGRRWPPPPEAGRLVRGHSARRREERGRPALERRRRL